MKEFPTKPIKIQLLKKLLLILFFLFFQITHGQIKLNHNIGEELIDTGMQSCEEEESWGKVFELSDFGVTTNEQFLITSGQVGIISSDNGAVVEFRVFRIDPDFPESAPVLLGRQWHGLLPRIDTPQIFQFDLEEPIVVPAGVERILVEIGKTVDSYNPNSAEVIIAGTEEDTGESWYMGCRKYYTRTSPKDLEAPVPNANFFINATGETFSTTTSGASTTLSHSVCDNLIKTHTIGCSYGGMSWSRDYFLNDFGISDEEEYVITSGQVGLHSVGWGVNIQFRIYKIDANFPDSFSETDLIGSSQEVPVFYFGSNTSSDPKIFHVEFDTPVVVPKGVERILVQVYQTGDSAFPASTAQDTGISWFRSYSGGCRPFGEFVDIKDLGWPDTRLYINVTGTATNAAMAFGMNISNNCSDIFTEFSLTRPSEISSVKWNFGDPASGPGNTSAALTPSHDFSADGSYTISATVTGKDGRIEVVTETIEVKEPPFAYKVHDLEACETSTGSGISNFDTSGIEARVLGGQTGMLVTYIDGSGKQYTALPDAFTNTVKDRETIRIRVARKDVCCYAETSFQLIVNPLPELSGISDILVCDPDNDGFTTFDLSQVHSELSGSNRLVEFYFQDGQQIPASGLEEVTNKIKKEETLSLRVTNTVTGCYNQIAFRIAVTLPPTAHALPGLTGCDDNNDGISEYFDTSAIEAGVLGGQTGMQVSYYTGSGVPLSGPLPNPYTNTQAGQETLTVRVTDPLSGCFAETSLELHTSSQPRITRPADIYACGTANNGIASFDTSTIEEQLTGGQAGLRISYYDEAGEQLPSPLPSNFQNTTPWKQTIFIRVESEVNSLCYSETSFDLLVNELPEIALESDYFLCALEPSLTVAASPDLDSWLWTFEDGSVISSSSEAKLTKAGTYTLQVSRTSNGITCENSFSFDLVRSALPVIEEVRIRELSDNNQIEVLASGDGDFEYSIDGTNFQQEPVFHNLSGGIYNVQVRDRNGCGADEEEVVLVDYPGILSPNNDGYNDRWHIYGVTGFPASRISIFDRYGKLLIELTAESPGWDGRFHGKAMPSDDYWFMADLGDGRAFKGHFSLIRR